jgi:hypothetical protein
MYRCPRVVKKLYNLFVIKDINFYFFLDDSYASTAHSENIAVYTGYIPPERKHPLLIKLKFSKNSRMIVYHCRIVCKNFKIFNETGKDFVLIQ